MAFNIQNWSRSSVSTNEDIVDQYVFNPVTNANVLVATNGCFRTYNYFSKTYTNEVVTGDSQATMFTAGYFDAVAYDLKINDLILCWSALDLTYQQYEVIQAFDPVDGSPSVILAPLGNLTALVILTRAQVLAMSGAPVQIVAAPGVGTAYQVVNWSVNMRPGATPVAFANGTNIVLQYDATAAGAGQQAAAPIPATAISTGTVSKTGMGGPAAPFAAVTTAVANQPIFISQTGTQITGGGANATVAIEMTYELIQTL